MISLPVIKSHYNRIPEPVRKFLVRGLLIFITWKILYFFFLLPERIIDKPLTNGTAYLSVKLLSTFCEADYVQKVSSATIMIDGRPAVGIGDECNALVLLVIHLGFIAAFPAAWRRKAWFGIGGALLILCLNTLRCSILAIISKHYLSIVDHHFIFNVIVYALIFFLWHLFIKSPLNEQA